MHANIRRYAISIISFIVIALIAPYVQAADVSLAWDLPQANQDGTASEILAGIRIHWGQASGKYTETKEIKDPNATSTTIASLDEGKTYYFAATAFDFSGNDSDFSNEVSTTIPLTPPPPPPPPLDTDGDGLIDEDERNIYGTDPNLADSDGDGFADGTEVSQGFDPSDPDSQPTLAEQDPEVLSVQSVTASDWQEPNVAANTLDLNFNTRWSALGDGQWLQYDLGEANMTVHQVAIAWFNGNQRASAFAIEVSTNGQDWTEVYSGDSSGTTLELEPYTFDNVTARYVRIVGFGNSANLWNSLTEVEIVGRQNNSSPLPPTGNDPVMLPVQSVTASAWQEPNVPANTNDSDFNTRWSALGDGQWLQYDLGEANMTVHQVSIAWFSGNQRTSAFAIEVSTNGQDWTEVYSDDSSGTTLELEPYTFAEIAARYVRIVGFGNSDNQWNSITEVEIVGTRK
jgi:hypothetical protein